MEGGCTYNYDAIFQYQPQQITVSTQIKSIQLLTRTITLSLGEVPKLHQKLITDTAKRDTNTFGTITAKTDDENHLTLFFTQTESSLTTENNILDNVYSAKTTDNVLSLTM
ncbi:MAG: hypothetical protein V8S84_06255, partial [Lachnospiraceae bacterium]